MKTKKYTDKTGFTIVELLVVIVVIGILAAITIVSYTGISQRAVVSSLQSDLNSASTQIKMYQTDNGLFPTSIALGGDYCPTPADARAQYCLKTSSGNSYTAYSAVNTTNPQTFSLTIKNINGTYFSITDSTSPVPVQPSTTDTYTIQSGSDDAHSSTNGGFYSSSWSSITPGDVSSYRLGDYMLFRNITITKNSLISSAKIHLYNSATQTGTFNGKICAWNVDNASMPSGYNDAWNTKWSTHTTAIVDTLATETLTNGTWYDSTSIASVIQEIVNRPGWVSGNNILIMWANHDDTLLNIYRAFNSYDASGTYAPKLIITHT